MAKSLAVIADKKTGKSYKREISTDNLNSLTGRKIGEEIDGIFFELPGYRMKITGGTTIDGFPMRQDLNQQGKRKLLIPYGSGERGKKGIRRRVTFRGAIVGPDIAQLNLVIVQYGPSAIEESAVKENA